MNDKSTAECSNGHSFQFGSCRSEVRMPAGRVTECASEAYERILVPRTAPTESPDHFADAVRCIGCETEYATRTCPECADVVPVSAFKRGSVQELSVRTAEEWFQAGERALRAEDLEVAVEAFSNAIRENPNLPEAFCNRAVVRVALLDYSGALMDLDAAISLDPSAPDLYRNRADLKQQMDDLEGAVEDYHRARNGGRSRVRWD